MSVDSSTESIEGAELTSLKSQFRALADVYHWLSDSAPPDAKKAYLAVEKKILEILGETIDEC